MAKKGVDIKIEANTKKAAEGIDKVSKQLDALSNSAKKSSFKKLTDSVTSLSGAFSFATKIIGKAKDAIVSCVDAYQTQAKAETLLETAVKNNPYLKDESVQKLKNYASELQGIGTIGDETLIPLMAQLVSSGRSEAETMEIMSAAIDVSASGVVSLDTAVKGLNQTYSGTTGTLSRYIPQIKDLTTEQLKSGEAVKAVAEAYKGMAQNTANTVGGVQKLKNSWGDFLEVLGKPFNAIINPIAVAFSGLIDGISGKFKWLQDKYDEMMRKIQGSNLPTADEINFRVKTDDITNAQKKVDELKKSIEEIKGTAGAQELDEMGEAMSKLEGASRETAENILKAFPAFSNMEKSLETAERAEEVLGRLRDAMKNGMSSSDMTRFLNGMKDREKAVYDYLSARGLRSSSTLANVDFILNQVGDEIITKTDEINKQIDSAITGGVKGAAVSAVDTGMLSDLETQYLKATANLDALTKKKAEQDEQEREAEAAKRREAIEAEIKQVNELGEKQLAAIQNNIDMQNRKIADGMQTDFDWEDYMNVALGAYTGMLEGASNLTYDESKEKADEFIAQILAKYQEAAGKVVKELEDFGDIDIWGSLKDEISGITDDTSILVEAQIEMLEKLKETWSEIPEAVKLIEKAIQGLKETMEKTDFQKWYEDHGKNLEKVQNIISKMDEAMQEYTSGQITRIQNQEEAELAALEDKYDKGLISEEEYNSEKEKIEKDAAEKEYKLELAQWASNIATTTGQIAMAVVSALAQGGPPAISIPMAAAVGALGAAQLASLIGSKPTPPSYATGGVVGGYSGASIGQDNTYIHARAGEMLLNAKQQRTLFDVANGSGASGGMKVNIRNYMGESAEVTPSLDGDTLNLVIDRRVNEQLSNGSYGTSLTRADTKRQGVTISN